MSARRLARFALVAAIIACAACGGPEPGSAERVRVHVPAGAGALEVGERLHRSGLIDHPRLFAAYARLTGAQARLKSGEYAFRPGQSWRSILRAIERGEVVTVPVTVPEGFTLDRIAPRLAELTGISPDSVLRAARDTGLVRRLELPGPTLEGYLFPETYRFARGVSLERVFETMARRYRAFWGPEERARSDSLGLSVRDVTTLASIVEREARLPEERRIIAGVFLNRLERGMPLQADPTVRYALGSWDGRLLYRDIEAVADDPYNTYTHRGLPPGPIASPGSASLEAVLRPAEVPYLYFVARPDGSHVFSTTQREHVEAKNRIRRAGGGGDGAGEGDPPGR